MVTKYDKFIAFLKALEEGAEIEIDGRTYAMGFDSNDLPRIAHKVLTINTSTKEEGYQYMEGLDLHEFNDQILYFINKISDEKLIEITANTTLNKIKNEGN